MATIRRCPNWTATGKRVFVRVDFNVPQDERRNHRRYPHSCGVTDDSQPRRSAARG